MWINKEKQDGSDLKHPNKNRVITLITLFPKKNQNLKQNQGKN
jgi:hypothetical protein